MSSLCNMLRDLLRVLTVSRSWQCMIEVVLYMFHGCTGRNILSFCGLNIRSIARLLGCGSYIAGGMTSQLLTCLSCSF